MKNLKAYLIILFILLGCKDKIVESDYNYEHYLPLKISNEWFYSSVPTDSSIENATKWEITDEVTINNNIYFVIERSKFNEPFDTLYYRFEGEKVIELFIGKSKLNYYLETILADFDLGEGEKFNYFWKFDEALTKEYYYDATVQSKSDSTITFLYTMSNITDIEFTITFQRNIGITRIFHFRGARSYLVRYNLN